MADPKAEQIIDAVKAVFEAMTGAYAPDKVKRTAAFHGGVLDSSLRTIYSVSPGPTDKARHAFGTVNNIRPELSIGVALCRTFRNLDEQERWSEQEELLRAAEDAIRADRQLGGLALDLVIDDIDKSAANTYTEGWAIAFMRIVVSYLHSETSS